MPAITTIRKIVTLSVTIKVMMKLIKNVIIKITKMRATITTHDEDTKTKKKIKKF